MIDTVVFENAYGERLIPHQRGVYMKYHDAQPPNPKIYRFELDGMDGALDMTEWAGETKYASRDVTIGFRDIDAKFYSELTQFCLGRKVKIMFSDDPYYYFYGRGNADSKQTRWHVTDGDMTFTCAPFRLARSETIITASITGGSGSVVLKAKRMSVIPTITLSAACTLTYDGTAYSLDAGTHTVNGIVITDRAKTMNVSTSSAATVTVKWRDGIL